MALCQQQQKKDIFIVFGKFTLVLMLNSEHKVQNSFIQIYNKNNYIRKKIR